MHRRSIFLFLRLVSASKWMFHYHDRALTKFHAGSEQPLVCVVISNSHYPADKNNNLTQRGPTSFDLPAILLKRENLRAISNKMCKTADSQDLKLKMEDKLVHHWNYCTAANSNLLQISIGGMSVVSGIANPKFWERPNVLTLRRATVFDLGHRFSKHKMTRYARNLGWAIAPFALPCNVV